MRLLVVYAVVSAFVILTSSAKKSRAVESLEISYTMNTSLDNVVGSMPVVYVNVENDDRVMNCISLIAERGLAQSLSMCKPFLDAAIAYCDEYLHERSGGRAERELILCSKMVAVINSERDLCSVGQKRAPPCNLLAPPPKRRRGECPAGELFGQLPGSYLVPVCFVASKPVSNTQQLPLKSFEKQNTISSDATNLNVGDILVKVYTIPIGQGDCNIISCNGGKNIIIFDCGSTGGNTFRKKNKRYNLIHSPFENAESVAILISHGHADHHNMIRKVLNPKVINLPPKDKVTVVLGGDIADYKSDLKTWLENVAGSREFLDRDKRIDFCSNSRIWFDLMPGNRKSRNTNERGMLMKLNCETCKSSLLFTGDMEGPTAKDMAGKAFLRATHYKMAHHGAAALANGKEWLEGIMPIEVHISHRYSGRYHHPRCAATNRLMLYCKVGVTSGASFAEPHNLICFGEKSENYKPYDKLVFHRIFSTAPRQDKICLIVVYFAVSEEATTEYYCDNAQDFSSTSVIF